MASGSETVNERVMIVVFAVPTVPCCSPAQQSSVYMVCRDTYWLNVKTTLWVADAQKMEMSQQSGVHCFSFVKFINGE